jgi:hypothetical protein
MKLSLSHWVKKVSLKLSSKIGELHTDLENQAIKAAKKLISHSYKNDLRARGDSNRQIFRGDAGIRQLINGIYSFESLELNSTDKKVYDDFLDKKEQLRQEIERQVYHLGVLDEFTEAVADEQNFIDNLDDLKRAVEEKAHKIKAKIKSTKEKKKS